VTHIICNICAKWQGNVAADGRPIGWLELYDEHGNVAGWFWDHDCGRIVIHPDDLPRLTRKQRIRRYPTPTG
jgi:hypothetical protein